MPNLIWLESGGDASADVSTFWNALSSTGTRAVDATVSHTGPRSIKLSTGNPAVTAALKANATDNLAADAGRRISFWMRFDALPSVNAAFLHLYQSNYTTAVAILRVLTTGVVRITPVGATAVDGTIVLAVNTWHWITLSYTITNTTTFRFQVYVNGVADANATAGTLTNTGSAVLSFEATTSWGVDHNVWFDDLYVDAGTDYTDPSALRVTAKRPAANNPNSFDTAIGASPANRWTNVNERPLSETNGWRHVATTDVQENYTLEAITAGDIDLTGATLVARMAWAWAKMDTDGTVGTPKLMDDGTEWALTFDTAPTISSIVSPPGNTPTVYPSNAAGIGLRSPNHANDIYLYECGTLLAYTENPWGALLDAQVNRLVRA